MLRTVLIHRINCCLLHLLEILQPLRIPKQNIILIHTVSMVLKNLYIFGPQQITLLITIIVCYVLEKFINADVLGIRTFAALCCCWWRGLLSSFIQLWGRRRGSFRCTGDTRICFIMKFLDCVILDKTMANQVSTTLSSLRSLFLQLLHGQMVRPRPRLTQSFFTAATKFLTWCRKDWSLPTLSNLYIHSSLDTLSMNATLHTAKN